MTSFSISEAEIPTRKICYVAPLLVFVGLLALVAAPWFADRAELRLLMEALSYLALAQAWNLLAGYAGLVSVGQQAYVGLGGYIFFALAILAGIPVIFALPLAGLLTGLVAIPAGWIAFRLKGAYFAIGTWVIAEIFRLFAAQSSALGGGSGISLPVKIAASMAQDRQMRELVMYFVALGLAVVAVFGVWALLRSKWGLALTAIRDSERAAEAVGVDTTLVKFIIFVTSAAFTGGVGAFIFLQKLRITPDAAFSVTDWTAFVIFIVVIGGIGTIEGPILGVAVFFGLRALAADWGAWYLILMGLTAIAVMLIDKRGIWGSLNGRWSVDLFPIRRKLY